jgi:hypothetical protein
MDLDAHLLCESPVLIGETIYSSVHTLGPFFISLSDSINSDLWGSTRDWSLHYLVYDFGKRVQVRLANTPGLALAVFSVLQPNFEKLDCV